MTSPRETFLVKREAYFADNDNPDCERRDTRYERRLTNHACQLKSHLG